MLKAKALLKDPFLITLIILIFIGIVLRFYNFTGFVTYLGDQGRDTIVMRRIVTLEHLPGIGASSSVGSLFLGPFYYYLVAPWLLITGFNPVGPALGVAFFSTLFIAVMYYVAKDLFDKKVAIIAAALTALSYTMVWFARFSWNPNLLPFSSLLTFYFFVRAQQKHRASDFFLAGVFLSISTQFHYVSLAFGLPISLLFVYYGFQKRTELKNVLTNLASMVFGFALLQAPLIIFEFKNNFINTMGFLKLFTESHDSGRSFIQELLYTLNEVNFHALQWRAVDVVSAAILIGLLCGLYIWRKKENRSIWMTSLFFILMLSATAVFTENKNRHYFGALYPLYYILIAYVIATYVWTKKTLALVVGCILIFAFMQKDLYEFFRSSGPDLIGRAEHISDVIRDNISDDSSIQITSLPDHYGDYMYRYYLEVWGHRPVERASLVKADELFVVCIDACKPIGDPQWDIAYFEPTKVVGTWKVEDVTIYKLTRANMSL
jgi:hypothetical protein